MNQPSGQSQSPQPSTPGHRDMMFCHECQDEWYRDERGLTCPECGSDFTEIIEHDNDPRDPEHVDDDDDDLMSDLEAAPPPLPPHPLHGYNPWRESSDDPEEGDISNVQWRQLGPGRYAVSMNASRTISPRPGGDPVNAPNAIGGFASLLNTIIGGGQGLGQTPNQNDRNQDEEGRTTPEATTGSGILSGGHRFTYSSSARLMPRETDRGPALLPQDDINDVLVGIMAAFGEPPGHHHHEFGEANPRGLGANPFMNLFAQMMPGNGQAGDFVYSQEGLDRIVSQLMEQTQTSSAPGPAPQSQIDALPRKPVSVDMLGSEGRAECSICMDEVNIGEQVTELPCHHWFHHQCVAAWLAEHDTCPHCRKGISKNSNGNAQASGGASGDPSRQMPGAFGATGEGANADPFTAHESPSQGSRGNTDASRHGSADETGSGLGDRLRRGLFGPPR